MEGSAGAMAPTSAATPATAADPLAASLTSLRDTAKWLVTIFGGIAAALIAGAQFSKAGQLQLNDPRLLTAALSALVALVAVGWVIHAALTVLVTGIVSVDELSDESRADRLKAEHAFLRQSTLLADPWTTVKQVRDVAFALAAKQVAGQTLTPIEEWQVSESYRRMELIPFYARYGRALDRFERARWAMLGGGGVAALSLLVFAWAANPPTPDPAPFRLPEAGVLRLNGQGRRLLSPAIGEACVQRDVKVLVLAFRDGRYDVVSLPDDVCRSTRLTVENGDLGVVTPAISAFPTATPVPPAQAPPAKP